MDAGQFRSERFRHVLDRAGPGQLWDTVLAETEDFVVVPTLGSIIPDWFLVVPKQPEINFRDVAHSKGVAPCRFLHEAARLLGLTNDWLWFEHGAAAVGTQVGCGVDYAHLHLLASPPFSFAQFRDVVGPVAPWSRCQEECVYDTIPSGVPYYVAGSGESAIRLEGHELGSQFFRKAVALLAGKPDLWDYKTYDFRENVVQTLDRFGTLAVAAE